ncbi:MAG: MerR family transcriptional regulator [Clostridiales bacterium]|nr:MerR family transcriptional regulator [Clostridiales bacterium]
MKYSVSDVSEMLGLTSSALHFYEKENLINVKRDENGHRYYTVVDVFRFLSYTKYRSMGFPLKTVVRQFSGVENDRYLIYERLRQQKADAQKKAAYYAKLAQYIDAHIQSANRIEDLLDQYEFTQSPHTLILHDEECGWVSKSRKAQRIAQKWVKAMPAMRLVVTLHSVDTFDACFGYAVTFQQAKELALPMDLHVQEMPAVSCLHTIVATSEAFTEAPHIVFEKPIAYARSRGFALRGKPWGHILLVEVAPEAHLKPYVELWIPIG